MVITLVKTEKTKLKMNKLEIQKELLRSKVNANFSHYVSGNLYYTVKLESGLYQFPISTIESAKDGEFGIKLSADLGTTTFEAVIKGSFLNRWIGKAIDNNEFILVLNEYFLATPKTT